MQETERSFHNSVVHCDLSRLLTPMLTEPKGGRCIIAQDGWLMGEIIPCHIADQSIYQLSLPQYEGCICAMDGLPLSLPRPSILIGNEFKLTARVDPDGVGLTGLKSGVGCITIPEGAIHGKNKAVKCFRRSLYTMAFVIGCQ